MNTSFDSQPILSRSAKILIMGFVLYSILGYFVIIFGTPSLMEITKKSESPNFDFIFYSLFIVIVFIAGIICLLISGMVYLVDKKKGIRFAFPKNEQVNIKHQTIYSVIPFLDMYASFKVKKFWIYVGIIYATGFIIYQIEESFFSIINPDSIIYPYSVIIYHIINIPVSMFIIRKFSEKWNRQYDNRDSDLIPTDKWN